MKKLMMISMFLVVALAMMAVAQGDQPTVQPYKGSTDECYQQCSVNVYKPCLAQGVSQEECAKKAQLCAGQCPEQVMMPASAQPAEKKEYYAPTEPAKVSPEQVQACQNGCSQDYGQCQAGGAPPGAPDCVSMFNECTVKCGSPVKPVEQPEKLGFPEKPYAMPSPEKVPPAVSSVSCVEQCARSYDEKTCAQAGVGMDICKQKIGMCVSSCEKKPETPMPQCPTPAVMMPEASCPMGCTKMYYECGGKAKGFDSSNMERAIGECRDEVGICLDRCTLSMPKPEMAKQTMPVAMPTVSAQPVDCEASCTTYDPDCLQNGNTKESCRIVKQDCLESCKSGAFETTQADQSSTIFEKPVGLWEKVVTWFFKE